MTPQEAAQRCRETVKLYEEQYIALKLGPNSLTAERVRAAVAAWLAAERIIDQIEVPQPQQGLTADLVNALQAYDLYAQEISTHGPSPAAEILLRAARTKAEAAIRQFVTGTPEVSE